MSVYLIVNHFLTVILFATLYTTLDFPPFLLAQSSLLTPKLHPDYTKYWLKIIEIDNLKKNLTINIDEKSNDKLKYSNNRENIYYVLN